MCYVIAHVCFHIKIFYICREEKTWRIVIKFSININFGPKFIPIFDSSPLWIWVWVWIRWKKTNEWIHEKKQVMFGVWDRLVPYIDVIFLVAQKQVVHDGGFVQLCQCGHVLHPVDTGRVHGVNRLSVHLLLLKVDHLWRHTHRYTGGGISACRENWQYFLISKII